MPCRGAGIVAFASLCAALLGACDGGTDVVRVASVAVSPDSATIAAGASRQLSATVSDADGAALAGRTVSWTSTNAAVATVDGTGLVTARAPGSAAITATSEGRSGTATVTVPVPMASLSITSIDGSAVARGQTASVRDTLAVRVRVTVPAYATPVGSVELVRLRADGVVEPLAQLATTIAAGSAAHVAILARSAPSGEYPVWVRTQAVSSDTAMVNLRRPATHLRIVSVNGQAAGGAGPLAIADSFRVTLAVTVADTATSPIVLTLSGDRLDSEYGDPLGITNETVAAGTTVHATFTAYTAPAGSYRIWPVALVSRPGTLAYVTEGPRVPVAVTQSDVTPPSLTVLEPLDGSRVATRDISIRATASDPRGVWAIGYGVAGVCGTDFQRYGTGPVLSPTISMNSRVCGLRVGANQIVIRAWDIGFNMTADTIVVHYAPVSVTGNGVSAAKAAAQPGGSVPRVERDARGKTLLVRESRAAP